VQQLLALIGTSETRCQEIAAEVICQAAGVEDAAGLLEPLVGSGAMDALLKSPIMNIRAAAASATTKLSIKAKALSEDASELSHILNTVFSVLKNSPLNAARPKDSKDESNDGASENKVSFSKFDSTGDGKSLAPGKNSSTGSSASGGAFNLEASLKV
jgi:hypothetical protein